MPASLRVLRYGVMPVTPYTVGRAGAGQVRRTITTGPRPQRGKPGRNPAAPRIAVPGREESRAPQGMKSPATRDHYVQLLLVIKPAWAKAASEYQGCSAPGCSSATQTGNGFMAVVSRYAGGGGKAYGRLSTIRHSPSYRLSRLTTCRARTTSPLAE